MKAVILAGGFGTRLSEETHLKPKPMVEIGGRPILWHIMKIYLENGINDFIICCGYKGYMIKEYFSNYSLHTSDVSFDFRTDKIEFQRRSAEPWKVTLVDTGLKTQTGGRLKRVRDLIGDEDFCFTYGDGLTSHSIRDTISYHMEHRKLATVTAVQPPGRFGVLTCDNHEVKGFQEKPNGDNSWINGGFFVLSPQVIDYIDEDNTIWEKEPMERLASEHQLNAFFHKGFWRPMDTLRDRNFLEELWSKDNPPWKIW